MGCVLQRVEGVLSCNINNDEQIHMAIHTHMAIRTHMAIHTQHRHAQQFPHTLYFVYIKYSSIIQDAHCTNRNVDMFLDMFVLQLHVQT